MATAAADTAAIEPSALGSAPEAGEFEPTDFDAASSSADSTSIGTSVYQHSYENGRRYHQYRHGRYPIPNDMTEQNREDMKHAMHLELTDGKLFLAPVENPKKIIDLGTGTGAWAVEVADKFPGAKVIGVDLSPIQPSWVPSNVTFVVDDFEDEWTSGGDFDLVHLRSMSPMVKNIPGLLDRAFKNMRPGGWIEFQEFGGQVLSDDYTLRNSAVPKFFERMKDALETFGMKNFYIANELGPHLEAAGFTNVTLKTIKAPVGTWPKDKTLRLCGMYMRLNLADFMTAFAAKPFQSLGMSAEEATEFVALVRKDLDDPTIHSYMNYQFWTAQKPFKAGKAPVA